MSRLTLHSDFTSVSFYKFAAKQQSQSGSRLAIGSFGAVLRFNPEKFGKVILFYANPCVANRDFG